MSQLVFPFDDVPSSSSSGLESVRLGNNSGSEDGFNPSEEKAVQAGAVARLESGPPAGTTTGYRRGPKDTSLQNKARWPAALTWDEALEYASISGKELRRWRRQGLVSFKMIGPRGKRVAFRAHLDQALAHVFSATADELSEDFDFG